MSDYLDAHQIARLECLKLLANANKHGTAFEILTAADGLAKWVIDGNVPDARPTTEERAA